MAPPRGFRSTARQGRATLRPRSTPGAQPKGISRGRGGRIEKHSSRSGGKWRVIEAHEGHDGLAAISHGDARDVRHSPALLPGLGKLNNTLRTTASIHACSELSLNFITQANLETDEDTNIICLNLMDHFLFSADNWLPELSYCKLHAACFLVASLLTGKNNTLEQIAESLGPESEFIQQMAMPLVEDEESAAAIPYLVSIDTNDAENGYNLLYQRRTQLTALVGQYASAMEELPSPTSLVEKDEPPEDRDEEENLDTF